jgi:hypothetical protein
MLIGFSLLNFSKEWIYMDCMSDLIHKIVTLLALVEKGNVQSGHAGNSVALSYIAKATSKPPLSSFIQASPLFPSQCEGVPREFVEYAPMRKERRAMEKDM